MRQLSVILVNPEDVHIAESVLAATNHLHAFKVVSHTLQDEYGINYGMVLVHEADYSKDAAFNIELCELAGLVVKHRITPDLLDEHELVLLMEHAEDPDNNIFKYGNQVYQVTDFTKEA